MVGRGHYQFAHASDECKQNQLMSIGIALHQTKILSNQCKRHKKSISPQISSERVEAYCYCMNRINLRF